MILKGGGEHAIVLLSNDLSHPALAKEQYQFSWRINRLRPLLKRSYQVIVVSAGGRVGPGGGPNLASLRPSVHDNSLDRIVLLSPPILRIPMLWLFQSMIMTPLFVLLFVRSRRLRVDAIIAASVSYGAVGKVLNRVLRTKLIVDYGDPDYARERSLSLHVLRIIERYVLARPGVDAVTCMDPNICDHVRPHRGTKQLLFLPPGGFWKNDDDVAVAGGYPRNSPQKKNSGRRTTILYAGHLAPPPAYRLDVLLGAAPEILERNPDSRIVIVGDGGYLPTIRRRVMELGIANSVELVGRVSYQLSKQYISEADVCLQLLNDMCLGTKVLDYFAMGKAVVSCGSFFSSYERRFLKDGENCVLVPPEAGRLAEAVCSLLSDPDMRKKLGENAYETVSTYDWDSQAEEILRLIIR